MLGKVCEHLTKHVGKYLGTHVVKKQGEHHQELEILYEFFRGLNMNGTSEFRQENVGIKKIYGLMRGNQYFLVVKYYEKAVILHGNIAYKQILNGDSSSEDQMLIQTKQ